MLNNTLTLPPVLQAARWLGLAAAVGTVLLYGQLIFFNPYSDQGLSPNTYGLAILMSLVALLAAWASLKLKAPLLVAAFLISFFPVGLYLLGTPGLFRWIGVCNLLYLVTGLTIAVYQRKRGL